jgi:Transglutaminase-like superfamily
LKPFELPASTTDSLSIHVGCALGYHADAKSRIYLLIRPSPELEHCVLHESITHSRGEVVEWLADGNGNTVLGTCLLPGMNEIRHSAVLRVQPTSAPQEWSRSSKQDAALPYDVVPYTLPSRYCESDKLAAMALRLFGQAACTENTVQEICDWTHCHIAYRYGSGSQTLSACETISRGYGVCRDFAHVMIALCRALDIPARYAAGHIPLVGDASPGSDIGIDFHAFVEVYIAGQWRVFDPRHNSPGNIHIKLAHGRDAVDTAIATFHGPVTPAGFEVWAYAADGLQDAGSLSPVSCPSSPGLTRFDQLIPGCENGPARPETKSP